MKTGDEERPITLTTRELIAAIFLFSKRKTFREAELVDRVRALRALYPGTREFSEASVLKHLRMFVIAQVLRYTDASDVFTYARRNDEYLRRILAIFNAIPNLESRLCEIVSNMAQKPAIRQPLTTEART